VKIKFIGGPEDGKIRDVYGDKIVVPVLEGPPWYSYDVPSTTAVTYSNEVYIRQKIVGSTEAFSVMTPDGWTGDDLIRELIERA
jgi:hypothetical protein